MTTRNGQYTARNGIAIRLEERFGAETMYSIAKRAGLDYMTVYNLAKGRSKRIDLSTLAALCDVLQCQPGDILILDSTQGQDA
jgi:putative transcriptional regulator